MSSTLSISVCIPAYNRSAVLGELLDSIFFQDYEFFDVVICEDMSPEREEIRAIVFRYQAKYPGRIEYVENPNNLGYDQNLRQLLSTARGDYTLFMGNDDLMSPGAIAHVADVLARHSDAAVYLRSYAAFEGEPENVVQVFRYFEHETYFPPGARSIATVYRRSVVIPGMTFHRETALKYTTDKFDGTLLYQLYLVAEILIEKGAVFSPECIVLYRNGGIPDFGNSEAERGVFQPNIRTPESSLRFIEGMLTIIRYIEEEHGVAVARPVIRDMANYSYPLLSIQADKPLKIFLSYGWELSKLGFFRYPIYWFYFIGLLLLGVSRTDSLIVWMKRRLGRTPVLGKVYQGEGP